jgi:hypothetical protein
VLSAENVAVNTVGPQGTNVQWGEDRQISNEAARRHVPRGRTQGASRVTQLSPEGQERS